MCQDQCSSGEYSFAGPDEMTKKFNIYTFKHICIGRVEAG